MRGLDPVEIASNLVAEASEHHGDGSVAAVLVCAFVGDEGGEEYAYFHHATPGEGDEKREAVKRCLRDWIAAIDDPGAAVGLGPDEPEGRERGPETTQ